MKRAIALTLLGIAGCQHYVPATINDLERPDRVRLHLSQPIEVHLTDVTANSATLVDGEVVRWDDESVVLSVWWVEAMGGLEFRGVGETVVVPRDHIASMEERKISALKSIGLAALIVGGIALSGALLAEVGSRGSDGENGVPK